MSRHSNRKNSRTPPPSKEALVKEVISEVGKHFRNTGYSGGGASSRKNYARGWEWMGGSPSEDIGANLSVLRQRSRDLWANSPIARAALERIKTNSVGVGLRLQSTPNADILGISKEEASAWARRMEWEFSLWAETRECDALGLNTFAELQSLALLSWLQSGDTFALLPMRSSVDQPYELKIHLIEADRVANPYATDIWQMGGGANPVMILPNGNRIENGVEIDPFGRSVAYWIARAHPLTIQWAPGKFIYDRVPIKDDLTGRTNIIHLMVAERPEQRRGVPFLSPVIEALKQLTRYAEAELAAAVIASLFTVFITSETPQSPLGESIPEEEQVSSSALDSQFQAELGPGAVVGLNPNEKIETANPMRPNVGFTAFVDAVARETGAALGIPYEVLLQAFTASYSASRAALLDFWKTAKAWRESLVVNFLNHVYLEFAWEAVLKGRLAAPGFTDDPSLRAAWLSCKWHGPAMGQIDPLKEIQASAMRMDVGVSTLAQEAMELTGSDWQANIEQRGIELQAMKDAGLKDDTPAVAETAKLAIPPSDLEEARKSKQSP